MLWYFIMMNHMTDIERMEQEKAMEAVEKKIYRNLCLITLVGCTFFMLIPWSNPDGLPGGFIIINFNLYPSSSEAL